MIKKLFQLLCITLSILFITVIAIMFIVFPPKPSEKMVHNLFVEHKNIFFDISEYLISCSIQFERIELKDGVVVAGHGSLNDKISFLSHEILHDLSFEKIIKEDNTIIFQRWSALADRSSGIMYTSEETPSLEFMTVCKTLGEKGWYYYETDINKYK